MKKYLLLALFVSLVLMASGVAYANFAIHGGYVADTDACAGCHRAHTATSMVQWQHVSNPSVWSNALLVGPPTDQIYIFCYVCHSEGAPGAATNVETGTLDAATSPGGQLDPSATANAPLNGGGFSSAIYYGTGANEPVTSYHEYQGAAWTAWGSGEQQPYSVFMDCISCHDPHGSSNYRILRDYVNGHDVGGYLGSFSTDPDPDPYPWVISVEQGYPYAGETDPVTGTLAPTDGFRKHRQYPSYRPSYTWARYARGYNGVGSAEIQSHGMSGWCTACHENYMAKVSVTPNAKATSTATVGDGLVTTPNSGDVDWDANRQDIVYAILAGDISTTNSTINVNSTSNFAPAPGYIQIGQEVMRYTGMTGTSFTGVTRGANNTPARAHSAGALVYQAYSAGDFTPGFVARHRHPVNVPLSGFDGPVALTYDPFAFYNNYPGGAAQFVDLPLDHDRAEKGTNQTYDGTVNADWIECLTCHRAHGVSTRMTGYAIAGLSGQSFPAGWGTWQVPNPANPVGVPPAGTAQNPSALLRADNRGVCERCHNK